MQSNRIITSVAFAVALTGLATSASAQSAGSVLLRIGATKIKPNVDSGNLTAPSLPGTQASVESDTQLGAGITYMVTDNFSLDIPLATPFKHQINGDGAINGVGKIAEVKALPMTLLGQWRFLEAASPFRPYLGAGVTYAKFYKAKSTAVLSGLTGGTPSDPTTLKIKSKFAGTLQAGLSYTFNQRWFVDANITHTFLKTTATLSTGQTLDMKLDPDSVSLSVGYAF